MSEHFPTFVADMLDELEIERIMVLSPDEIRAELAAQGIDPDEAVRVIDRAATQAFAVHDVHRAFRHLVAAQALPEGIPMPVHASAEVEQLSRLNPDEIAADLLVRGIAADKVAAARIVEEAADAAVRETAHV